MTNIEMPLPSLNSVPLLAVQPSQFLLSKEKLDRVHKWFHPDDLSAFSPLPVKFLHGRIVFTDGHTRAYAAFLAGLSHVPLAWDTDEMDWDAYQRCVDACRSRGVLSICDLGMRVVDAKTYQREWLSWCAETFKTDMSPGSPMDA